MFVGAYSALLSVCSIARLTACSCGLPLTATSNFWSSCLVGRSETSKPATFAKRCRSCMSRAGGSG